MNGTSQQNRQDRNQGQDARATIAVPRVLWWFRRWPFWKTFFEALGRRVVTNDPARPTPHRHDRASTIVEEACYPIQLLLDRTLAVAGEADALFMPRLISTDARGIMCPRFSGVPDIVRMVVGSDRRLLAPVIDAREGHDAVRNAYLSVAADLGASGKQARRALQRAAAVQKRFDAEFEQRLNRLPPPDVFAPEIGLPAEDDEPGAVRIALLGHPYVAYDWEFNLGLVEKLRSLGAWVVPVESVDRKRIERLVRSLDKNVYWTSGRDILGAALAFFDGAGREPAAEIKKGEEKAKRRRAAAFQGGGIDGVVYLSCFKCGVDGLLTDVVRWASRHQSHVAYLPLTLDGHDNEMGLMTRLEAFMDIVQGRVRASGKP